eukprot:3087367-Alexandrium_andersonii.AAC.1
MSASAATTTRAFSCEPLSGRHSGKLRSETRGRWLTPLGGHRTRGCRNSSTTHAWAQRRSSLLSPTSSTTALRRTCTL